VPAALRNRYAEARRLSLGPIKRDLGNQILKLLGRKPAAPDASTQAYDRIATMTGDRDVTA
jgi:ribosome recycling factor